MKFTYKIREEIYIASDVKQFKECTRALKKAIERERYPKIYLLRSNLLR